MTAAIVSRSRSSFTLQIEIPYSSSMLDFEESVQRSLNEGGVLATQEALQTFDADGSPIVVGETRLTSKGKVAKEYQTPYGVAVVERHVYQSPEGGKTFCPLDQKARIVVSSTPKFAKMISHKYAEFGSSRVTRDLEANHSRSVARSFVQNVADAVAAVALAKEETWNYEMPTLEEPVATITIGLDGACILMSNDGWREAMVGTVGFYDKEGERLHTTYLAASPEYGKETFLKRLEDEIARTKRVYPEVRYLGLADGAKGNWEFLERHTEFQLVDFWHASEYLGKAAAVLFRGQTRTQEAWMEERCHRLKHESGAAGAVIKELKRLARERPWATKAEEVTRALTYFQNQNQKGRMNYSDYVNASMPIGSGVTEAACKLIIKQRLCGSGMKWKDEGAAAVLSLRSLSYTPNRWEQFWKKIDRYGFVLWG
jgi:hypothetical protein